MKRVILIVLDSVGIGAAPDAQQYGDAGADTVGHVLAARPDTSLPVLADLGLFAIPGTSFYDAASRPQGACARLQELSPGKDTITGHWEMMGIRLAAPFPTYPEGFPQRILGPFMEHTGRGVLGNRPASGTRILEELGPTQQQTGEWIVYTSADSVMQIAAHEDVIPLQELYAACEYARGILRGSDSIGRVIARPYVGRPGAYARTPHRRDFALKPPHETVLDRLQARGVPTCGVGKIHDIFAGAGVDRSIHTDNNLDGINKTLAEMERMKGGLLFVNLVDFDMQYGHRNDAAGYAAALMEADESIGKIRMRLTRDDLLLITADHGCDPLHPGTDHTREYVPLLAAGAAVRPGTVLGTRRGFEAVGETAAAFLGLAHDEGASLWRAMKGDGMV